MGVQGALSPPNRLTRFRSPRFALRWANISLDQPALESEAGTCQNEPKKGSGGNPETQGMAIKKSELNSSLWAHAKIGRGGDSADLDRLRGGSN